MNYEARGKFREHAQRCVRCARVTFYFSFQMRQLFGQFGLQLGHCEGTGKKLTVKKLVIKYTPDIFYHSNRK